MTEITEQFYSQVSESIKLVFDLTSRIDERVKILMEKQSELDDRLSQLIDNQNSLISRITILESKDISSMNNEMVEMSRRLGLIESNKASIGKDVDQIKDKLHALELQSGSLQIKNTNSENNWNRIVDMI